MEQQHYIKRMSSEEREALKHTLSRPIGEMVKDNFGFIWLSTLIIAIPAIIASMGSEVLPSGVSSVIATLANLVVLIFGVTRARAVYKRFTQTGQNMKGLGLLEAEEDLPNLVIKAVIVNIVTSIVGVAIIFGFTAGVIGLLAYSSAVGVNILLLAGVIIVGTLAALFSLSLLRPIQYLLVLEPQMGVKELVRNGLKIGRANAGALIILQMKLVGAIILGMMLFMVGLIYAIPYIVVKEQIEMYHIMGYADELYRTGNNEQGLSDIEGEFYETVQPEQEDGVPTDSEQTISDELEEDDWIN